MFSRLLLATALVLPGVAMAVDTSPAPPTPTETTTRCRAGMVWDERTEKCVEPQDSRLDDDQRYQAARELAWAGRPDQALAVLETMTEGDTDRVLTYKGFATRKAGDMAGGMAFYNAALTANPDNLLARAYMGQALVEQGDTAAAKVQLAQIRARGGTGSWPETALARSIETGLTPAY